MFCFSTRCVCRTNRRIIAMMFVRSSVYLGRVCIVIIQCILVLITDTNAGIKITHGRFCSFSPHRGDTFHQLLPIWYVGGNQQSPMLCQISGKSVHFIMEISDPKNFKNPECCKLIHPVGLNPSINIHEIYKFYGSMGSTKMFQIWCHSVPSSGSYRQKTAIGQFLPKFSGAPGAKTMDQIRKS